MNLEEKGVAIASLIAGLNYLHGKGLIHGSIKPANPLRANGIAKLTDCGSGGIGGGSTRRTMTENYAAPETASDGIVQREGDMFTADLIIFFIILGDDFLKAGGG